MVPEYINPYLCLKICDAGHDIFLCVCLLQNRYMKAAKDWGWREFVTLHTLFDADAGFLVNDDCVFAAEVLMLRESSEAKQVCHNA